MQARVRVPASKSITNRALVLGALADGPAVIGRPLLARDTELMMAALRAMGPGVEVRGGDLHLTPGPLQGPARVDCGLAGTVMRFVPPVAALAHGRIDFDGDPRAHQRPLGTLLGALSSLGATVPGTPTGLPFTVDGHGGVSGGTITLDASASSQFVSGLLLSGARFTQGVDVRHAGTPLPSLPHITMTVGMLRERGVDVDDAEPNRWVVRPGQIRPVDAVVEPDLSNAAPFAAAAVVTGGEVTVAGWPRRTTQPGDRLREILTEFGASVSWSPDGLTVTGTSRVHPVDLDLHDVGELTPVLAAIAAVADAPSRLHGIAHLRGHETNRLTALATELDRCGCHVEVTDDGLRITPRPLHGTIFHTYDDHRMAQAAAVLGLVTPHMSVEDIATTRKTHPDFVTAWTAMQGPAT